TTRRSWMWRSWISCFIFGPWGALQCAPRPGGPMNRQDEGLGDFRSPAAAQTEGEADRKAGEQLRRRSGPKPDGADRTGGQEGAGAPAAERAGTGRAQEEQDPLLRFGDAGETDPGDVGKPRSGA